MSLSHLLFAPDNRHVRNYVTRAPVQTGHFLSIISRAESILFTHCVRVSCTLHMYILSSKNGKILANDIETETFSAIEYSHKFCDDFLQSSKNFGIEPASNYRCV